MKRFEFNFEDMSSKGSISFEYADDVSEKMTVVVENGVPVIYGNREAFLLLAKTCAKLALGQYQSGFHVHLAADFDADLPEAVRLILNIEMEAD
ncbi:MAG: hypothetical protein HOP19_25010 [Acidobacteria bacterium]|nr:hypothetical protein [Acidobacteriota bacterium]